MLTIAFVTGGLSFNGKSLETQSLGGSETALACMAKELAKRGHKVFVFCETDEEGEFDGVTYNHLSRYSKFATTFNLDVLVVSRFYQYLAMPSKAGLRVLWCHDILTDKDSLMAHLWQTDFLMLLSDYHIDNYTKGPRETHLPDLKPNIWKTSNGVDLDVVEKNLRPKESKKLIFTSRPERGLHFLLGDIFPKILEKHPDAKLYFANYDISRLPNVAPHVQQIAEFCAQRVHELGDSVVPLGHLTKAELYRHISSAQVLLAPTNFPEISMITAMEAAACGTPVVGTRDFALTETIADGKTGILIPGQPPSSEYSKRFANAVNLLLTNKKTWEKMSKAGPKHIKSRGYHWDKVAERWETKFIKFLNDRWEKNKPAVIKELNRVGDVVAASAFEGLKTLPCTTRINTQPAKILEEFKSAVPRYQRLCEMLESQGFIGTEVLDWEPTDASFGVVYARANPNANVTIYTTSEELPERLEQYAIKAGVDKRVKIVNTADALEKGSYGLIAASNLLEHEEEPHLKVAELEEYASPGAQFVFTSQSGATQGLLGEAPNKLWNFTIQDFRDLFGDGEGAIAFVEEGISSGGDLYGNWVGVIPTNNIQPQAIDLERRKRQTRPYRSLVTCMIARDAENFIVAALKPLREVSDRVILALDSRSQDRTEELAAPYVDEIRVIDFDNFGQMRNASIAGVTEDWIAWIDADEVLLDGPRLRRYLQSEIFNGLGIRQNHLMLDVHGTYDVPIRFFKNKPHYKFTGYIHEHAEDVSKNPFNDPIAPSVLLMDLDLLHYGYPNESRRRDKCSNRNMHLLIRDAKDNGLNGRILTWILVMRDYLNIAKWSLQKKKNSPVIMGSVEHKLICAAVKVFLKFFTTAPERYQRLAWSMYQEALSLLGMSGVPFDGRVQDTDPYELLRPAPPFQVRLYLRGAFGGLDPNKQEKAEDIWFIDDKQYLKFMSKKTAELAHGLGVTPPNILAPALNLTLEADFAWNDAEIDLLQYGTNAIDGRTGLFTR